MRYAEIEASTGLGDGITFSELITLALDFAKSSGLLVDPRVERAINQAQANGGAATMIMLGNAVFSTAPFPDMPSVPRLLNTAAHLIND